MDHKKAWSERRGGHVDRPPPVCFPLPRRGDGAARGPLRRLTGLLPGRWRRRVVVIHGTRFWLPN